MISCSCLCVSLYSTHDIFIFILLCLSAHPSSSAFSLFYVLLSTFLLHTFVNHSLRYSRLVILTIRGRIWLAIDDG